MSTETKELLDDLITSINLASYDEITDCLTKQLYRFKYDMGNTIKEINPKRYYDAGSVLRELHTRIELLLKLSDYIDYIGVLQGSLIK